MHIFEDPAALDASTEPTGQKEDPKLIRLSVNLNLETAAALKGFADRRGLSFTESIRRVISIAHFIDAEIREGRSVHIVDEDRRTISELEIY